MPLPDLLETSAPAAPPRSHEWQLRTLLTNIARGIMHPNANCDGLEICLRKWHDTVMATGPASPEALHAALFGILDDSFADDHFLGTGRAIKAHLDERAAVVVDHIAIRDWCDDLTKTPPVDAAELEKLRAQCASLQSRCAKPDRKGDLAAKTVGKAPKAVWLAPFLEPLVQLFQRGRDLAKHRASDGAYGDLADEAFEWMGFSQKLPQACLIGLVTKRTLGELLTPPPASPWEIVGPSAVEGGSHTRWRHWVADWGRTYRLNSGDRDAGVLEAVRRPLALGEVSEFIFLGAVSKGYIETDDQFARVMRVDSDLPALLVRLHLLTGI